MELFKIGKTQKPHGLTGEIRVVVEEMFLDELSSLKVLFIKIGGKPVPFFVESIGMGNLPFIKFEDVNTREEAKKIGSKELSVRKGDLSFDPEKVDDDHLKFGFLKGFTIKEETMGELGLIEEVLEFPQQEMAVIQVNKTEFFIPLNNSFIKNIDLEGSIVEMQLPEGIVER